MSHLLNSLRFNHRRIQQIFDIVCNVWVFQAVSRVNRKPLLQKIFVGHELNIVNKVRNGVFSIIIVDGFYDCRN